MKFFQVIFAQILLTTVIEGRNCDRREACVPFRSCPSAIERLRAVQGSRNPALRKQTVAQIRKDICGAASARTICCPRQDSGPGPEDEQVFLGNLSNIIHDIAGEVYAVGRHKLLIKGFHYDGEGPDAFLLADTVSASPNRGGRVVIPYPSEERHYAYDDPTIPILPAFNGEDVLLSLPTGVAVNDLTWISVWCRQFDINFGHIIIL